MSDAQSHVGHNGALGAAGRQFVDWLARAGFSIWQVLPLGPPGDGGSPYWSRSDFAGQESLIDPAELPHPEYDQGDYQHFLDSQRSWLDDYVLFEALAARFQSHWWDWPAAFATREAVALAEFARAQAADLEQRRRRQWHFDWQWRALRNYARQRGVFLLGDLPIYVAPDSVATWSQPRQFQLQASGRPALLAGVPPDYFSADGQLWGNPLYDWAQGTADGFAFWKARLGRQLQRFDIVRIDHFRGLAAYWAVPAGARTARDGHWVQAPGQALLQALTGQLHELALVAEDLGVITPDVEALRREFALPGMRVLQFGFDGAPDNPHLVHNLPADVVAYTGTHDNDTTRGWYDKLGSEEARRVNFYLDADAGRVVDCMIRACLASQARTAILPAQDLLSLGSEARFNTPGTVAGNWQWRLPAAALTPALADHYRAMNHVFGRGG